MMSYNIKIFLYCVFIQIQKHHEVKIAKIQRQIGTQVMTLLLGGTKFIVVNTARALRTARAGTLGGRFKDGLFEEHQEKDFVVNEGASLLVVELFFFVSWT